MSNNRERSIVLAFIGKLVTTVVGIAAVFVLGIVIAACINNTSFTGEWANMIAWFATWAK